MKRLPVPDFFVKVGLKAKFFAPEQVTAGVALTWNSFTVMAVIGYIRLQWFEQCTPESLAQRSAAKRR
jgi:hypothetical protein